MEDDFEDYSSRYSNPKKIVLLSTNSDFVGLLDTPEQLFNRLSFKELKVGVNGKKNLFTIQLDNIEMNMGYMTDKQHDSLSTPLKDEKWKEIDGVFTTDDEELVKELKSLITLRKVKKSDEYFGNEL
jgi:hypothetical protein